MPVGILLTLPFLFILVRRPVIRRLALRSALRRKREAMLVVLGSLLGTAIMTGSFVVGDTLDASVTRQAYAQLGPIDEVVSVQGLASARTLEDRLAPMAQDPQVDGLLTMTVYEGSAATLGDGSSRQAARRAAPLAQVIELDFAEARGFGGDPEATGISGATPAPGHAVVGEDLARALAVGAGDEIEVYAYDGSLRLEVDRVLPQRGVAGVWLSQNVDTRSRNVFVAPGTLLTLAPTFAPVQATAAGQVPPSPSPSPSPSTASVPPLSVVAISNRGGIEGGAELTASVTHEIEKRTSGLGARIVTIKQDVLDLARTSGEQFTQLFSSMGMFGVLAGVLLLVNIFVMLAEERKSELGTLRALGLRRSSLVAAFATEGWLYSITASILGTGVGLGLGRLIIVVADRIFSSGPEEEQLPLRFAAEASSLQAGFAVGFAIALVTVTFTSIRISRFNIIHAIRDITETRTHGRRRGSRLLGAAGVLVGVAAFAIGIAVANVFAVFLGPIITLVGIAPLVTRGGRHPRATTALSATALAWGMGSAWVTRTVSDSANFSFFVVHGVVITGAAVLLFSQNQELIGHALSRLGRRRLDLRLGLAYPLARRFRTGMTLAMFSLVIFTISLFTIFSAMFANQRDAFTKGLSGSFDVLVKWNPANPISPDELGSIEGVKAVAPLQSSLARFETKSGEQQDWRVAAIDESFARIGAPELDDRGTYPSDAAAYAAIIEDPDLILVDQFFLQNGGGPPTNVYSPGDKLVVTDPFEGARRELTIAAIAAPDMARVGALMGMSGARELLGNKLAPAASYVQLDDGVDPARFAAEIEGSFLERGARADSLVALVDENLALQNQFFVLIRGYLSLGLIVGVAGLGVVMVRAVRERRRQIGVLRSLGFRSVVVRRSFVIEAAFVALEGVAIGVSLAMVTAFNIISASDFGEDFGLAIPYRELALLVAGTTIAALVATAAPARAAARTKPAVALRIAD